MAASSGRRAVIIGGSMSGLFTAAFLRRIGWDVDVFERSPVELVGRGAGITTHPELLDALERAISVSKSPSASPSTVKGASSANVRCGKSSPPGTGCSGCCAQPSIRRITI
jgi:UDP-N-acetylmuramoylalanine-D-glutamate ligase